jgi:hypothetical protein
MKWQRTQADGHCAMSIVKLRALRLSFRAQMPREPIRFSSQAGGHNNNCLTLW